MRKAAKKGDLELLQLVVDYAPERLSQADQCNDAGGSSPLHLAAIYDQADAVRLLLNSGAAVNQANSTGRTPLGVAKSDTVKQLLRDAGGEQ